MRQASDFHEGQGVVYRHHPDAPPEDGVVTSVNERYVFVRYRGDNGSKATSPADLRPLLDDSYPKSDAPDQGSVRAVNATGGES